MGGQWTYGRGNQDQGGPPLETRRRGNGEFVTLINYVPEAVLQLVTLRKHP
jgi:hypothetical protein